MQHRHAQMKLKAFMYLVRYKAVQRSYWSRVRGLHLAQVGQQWQLSLLVAALVSPVRHHPSQEMMHQGTFLAVKVKTDWWSGVLTPFLDAPLPGTLTVQRGECNSSGGCGSLWTRPEPSGQVGASGSRVLFSETQGWERDNAWYRCDRAGRRVTPGRSESCPPAAEIQTLRTARDKHWFRHCWCSLNSFSVIEWRPELTFDPAHGVDNDRCFSALGASSPQELEGFQVPVQVRLTGRVTVVDHVLWCALMSERGTCEVMQQKSS